MGLLELIAAIPFVQRCWDGTWEGGSIEVVPIAGE
jgi:hypothetical protein